MRGKTRSLLYGALSVFIVTFVMNVMVLRTNIVDSPNPIHSENQLQFHSSVHIYDKSLDKEEAYANFVAQGQRKPKAAYESDLLKELRQSSLETVDLVENSKQNLVENSLDNTQKLEKSFLNRITDNDKLDVKIVETGNVKNNEENEEEDYEDDDDYDDADDELKEDEEDYENSEESPKNKLFEPGDFVNASKIVFERPLLKYQEVPKQNQGEENIDETEKVIRQNFKTLTGNQMVTDGIYWSDAAEMAVPKGMLNLDM